MHGIIFSELRKYAETKHGSGTWSALLKQANLGNKVYLPLHEYPDAEVVALVSAASAMTGQTVPTVLEDFGEFIAPALMKMYGHLMRLEWKTIDVIDNTEGTVHTVVRANNPGANPPNLKTVRLGKDEVTLIYTSPRQMCALAIGIGRGLAKYFEETIAVNQTMCMHQGAPHCEIVFPKV
jgi:predicted hydrocarbon binding protein